MEISVCGETIFNVDLVLTLTFVIAIYIIPEQYHNCYPSTVYGTFSVSLCPNLVYYTRYLHAIYLQVIFNSFTGSRVKNIRILQIITFLCLIMIPIKNSTFIRYLLRACLFISKSSKLISIAYLFKATSIRFTCQSVSLLPCRWRIRSNDEIRWV